MLFQCVHQIHFSSLIALSNTSRAGLLLISLGYLSLPPNEWLLQSDLKLFGYNWIFEVRFISTDFFAHFKLLFIFHGFYPEFYLINKFKMIKEGILIHIEQYSCTHLKIFQARLQASYCKLFFKLDLEKAEKP